MNKENQEQNPSIEAVQSFIEKALAATGEIIQNDPSPKICVNQSENTNTVHVNINIQSAPSQGAFRRILAKLF